MKVSLWFPKLAHIPNARRQLSRASFSPTWDRLTQQGIQGHSQREVMAELRPPGTFCCWPRGHFFGCSTMKKGLSVAVGASPSQACGLRPPGVSRWVSEATCPRREGGRADPITAAAALHFTRSHATNLGQPDTCFDHQAWPESQTPQNDSRVDERLPTLCRRQRQRP